MNDKIVDYKIDTSFFNTHQYSPLYNHFFTDLGNPGTPVLNLVFNASRSFGFNNGIGAWNSYFNKEEKFTYWDVKRPYTDIHYVQGQSRLLGLQFLHTQNLRKGWNIGLEINRYGSKGYYLRQNGDVSQVRLFQSFESTDKRSQLLVNIQLNKVNQEINGGIANDSLFNISGNLQRASFPVNLQSTVNYMKQSEIFLEYSYGLSKTKITYDSSRNENFFKYRLYYSFERNKQAFVDSSLIDDYIYYNNIFKDSLRNFDSSNFTTYKNSVYIASTGFKKLNDTNYQFSPLVWRTGYQIEYLNYYNNSPSSGKLYNQSVNFNIQTRYNSKPNLFLDLRYIFTGYNQKDYLYKIGLEHVQPKHKLYILASLQRYTQPVIYSYFKTNFIFWAQNLDPTTTKSIQAKYIYSHKTPIELNLKYNLTNNYIYFDTHSKPNQYSNNLHHTSLTTNILWHFKKLYINEFLLLQYNSNTDITPL
ncbi:MAG: hypothetical protein HYZ42_08355, partial [Bacteroidetes bacterium]|nr:hypothetical protein [Bacteroidota bacterium]